MRRRRLQQRQPAVGFAVGCLDHAVVATRTPVYERIKVQGDHVAGLERPIPDATPNHARDGAHLDPVVHDLAVVLLDIDKQKTMWIAERKRRHRSGNGNFPAEIEHCMGVVRRGQTGKSACCDSHE